MKVIDPGHIYDMWQLGSEDYQRLTFIKRSGGAIQYSKEWPGVQVQEVLRVLIDRSEYLDGIIPCVETEDAIWHLQMALFCFEARAYRRKVEGLNRQQPEHDDSVRPKPWREEPLSDIPFNEIKIEKIPIGADGHIVLGDK
jgi:hypothetical protein